MSHGNPHRKTNTLLIVHVDVHVLPNFVDDFIAATKINCRASVAEPGVARFDLIQDRADPSHFLLVEMYRHVDDPAAHKQTAHYKTWAAAVEKMMAKPRTSTRFANIFPATETF